MPDDSCAQRDRVKLWPTVTGLALVVCAYSFNRRLCALAGQSVIVVDRQEASSIKGVDFLTKCVFWLRFKPNCFSCQEKGFRSVLLAHGLHLKMHRGLQAI